MPRDAPVKRRRRTALPGDSVSAALGDLLTLPVVGRGGSDEGGRSLTGEGRRQRARHRWASQRAPCCGTLNSAAPCLSRELPLTARPRPRAGCCPLIGQSRSAPVARKRRLGRVQGRQLSSYGPPKANGSSSERGPLPGPVPCVPVRRCCTAGPRPFGANGKEEWKAGVTFMRLPFHVGNKDPRKADGLKQNEIREAKCKTRSCPYTETISVHHLLSQHWLPKWEVLPLPDTLDGRDWRAGEKLSVLIKQREGSAAVRGNCLYLNPCIFSCFCPLESLPHPTLGAVSEHLGGCLAVGQGQPTTCRKALGSLLLPPSYQVGEKQGDMVAFELDFLHMKDLLPEHPQIRIIWLCMYDLIFCLTLSALFLNISKFVDCIGLKFRYKKLLNWVGHSAGNMIPVLKSDKIACFLLCVISFSFISLKY
ncbi:uncharacterized protein LOC133219498 [Neopsephotus bourkii]|uniref:uncharacterized protein LOC133219498 n=1 Tax=Neopsephotus bourkii TaxID=309878 RepID=UPI002AA59734|nr:uncharacterized protein LOC133219498 [Neopsephotus bourkii]